MYRLLNKEEMIRFIDKYFREWNKDIKSVSVISYDNINEYLINGHYIFLDTN